MKAYIIKTVDNAQGQPFKQVLAMLDMQNQILLRRALEFMSLNPETQINAQNSEHLANILEQIA